MSELSAELLRFLRDCMSSYEGLETLLLLARSPTRAWSSREISESLSATQDTIDSALSELVAIGTLVQAEPRPRPTTFRFAPSDEDVRARVTELQRAYVEQRFAIVQVMSANAMERIRGAAARRLADAFRFERSKK